MNILHVKLFRPSIFTPSNLISNYLGSFTLALLLILATSGCRKFINVGPPITSINQANVFNSDNSAIQDVTGFYAVLSDQNTAGNVGTVGGLYCGNGLLADELVLFDLSGDATRTRFYTNGLQSTNPTPWNTAYTNIFRANLAIEGLTTATSLRSFVQQELLGEAKFFRAFNYFQLVNLYGDIPLVLQTDPEVNRLLPRTNKQKVYEQIIQDLKEAVNLLSSDFLDAGLQITSERTRPNKWAAKALLARVYLYTEDFYNAEQISLTLILENRFQLLASLDDVFLKNSNETIWSLQPVRSDATNGYNSGEGKLFVLPSTGPNTTGTNRYPVYLSRNVMNNFEPGDLRKTKWTDSVIVAGKTYNFPFKYKAGVKQTTVKEYSIVFRIAEQYLIHAEACARQNKISSAIADLNALRNRARSVASAITPNPLPVLTTGLSQTDLYKLIERERVSELFTEWGHRWFDLKRTPGFNNINSTRADEVMPNITSVKGGVWSPNWKLLPIPQSDILQNPNLANHQNPGYN